MRKNRHLYYLCIPENNAKMQKRLLDIYAVSTFNTCPHRPFHCMARPPIEIHVNPLAKLMACNTPSPISLHRQQKVHNDPICDEAMGIFEECHTAYHCMVITRKYNESPRRIVDLSLLNKFCKRETKTYEKPFHLARKVPRSS